jgi:hydrogenase maturation protein HypF
MLFDLVDEPAFVMTSANPPNQPIVKEDSEALKTLGETADYFLFHNRHIAHRCDDSVIRLHGEKKVFIRRSRGYAPAPIILKEKAEKCVLALGGELSNTSCILQGNKAFISQHIGDVENVETMDFLKQASMHLIRLTNSKVDVVACDLHPKFTTTKLAQDLAEENFWQSFQVQHHYAHLAALMAEHSLEEVVGVCCDGYGYGLDGEAWGGEIILGSKNSLEFKRLAHLERHPLIGGDLATRYPLRMAAGILYKHVDVEGWLNQNSHFLPHGMEEARLIMRQLKSGRNIIQTTSCGRVLDAVAAVLKICHERTYEGEPAMKLESAASKGSDVLNLEPVIRGKNLDTTRLLIEIFENRVKYDVKDLAFSAHAYLAKGLATLAIEAAFENGVKAVGFSGGVACNEIMTSMMRKKVEASGLKFFVHEAIPPGDGGLSMGQAFFTDFMN